ncbi:MAG: LysM peptidoglycan-binding domain-containing protein, partial [Candidatus Handelsmanbacteria bacterium]|nr:LysM peptidoglycan-binding domain-containing protein [Candidatus Handelsmanbacteria bacterium]
MRWSHWALAALVLWAGLPGKAQAKKNEKPSEQVHVVRRGENLSSVAQRYHLTVAQLRQHNRLRGDQLRVGQRLKLPPTPRPTWHRVKRGETLAQIARRYQLDLALLRRYNHLDADRILVGQRLRLSAPPETIRVAQADPTPPPPTPDSAADAQTDSAETTQEGPEPTPNPEEEEPPPPPEYVVGQDETLAHIAGRFEISPGLLRQLNNLKQDRVRPGQRLRLRPSPLDEGAHVVRPGETLTGIAGAYRLEVEKLRE